MFDSLYGVWAMILGWFHPDIAHGVFWGSLLVTFVASVMGKDQQQRLDQGKFGLAAGTSLGGLSGLLKNEPVLVVVGFVGSAVGGLLGWLYYLALAYFVAQAPTLASLVVFQSAGLEGLQKKLDVQSKENLRSGFSGWTEKFARMMAHSKVDLLGRAPDSQWAKGATAVIRDWLTTSVDTLALVFGTLADKPQYQSRVTIIVYRLGSKDGKKCAVGRHWISYAGQLKPHLKDQLFDEKSVGYKVLTGEFQSPYFTTNEIAKKQGQTRPDDATYRPFITFRLNDSAILALDWPEELQENDNYVEAARSLFYSTVTPTIADVLNSWPRSIADDAGVPPLLPPPAPQTSPPSKSAPAVPPTSTGQSSEPHDVGGEQPNRGAEAAKEKAGSQS